MIEKFYTTEQVAELLQVHQLTILKFIKQGKLSGVKIGRMYRIPESSVEQFLTERQTVDRQIASESKSTKKDYDIEKKPKTSPKDDDNYYII